MKYEITIKNDGKEKYQSYEAKLTMEFSTPGGFSEVTAYGLGSTEEEARADLNAVVKRTILILDNVKDEPDNSQKADLT